MSDFTSRFERLELKFLIDELDVHRVRRQIEPFCVRDRHCGGASGRGPGYPIQSLYLDTPGLAFHEAKERGDPERLKLRVRTYSASSPATFEVKRRRSNVIDKRRAVVDRELTEQAAHGALRPEQSKAGHTHLQDFSRIVAISGAHPTLTIRYDREAYESVVDDYARVTFDRAIAAAPTSVWSLQPEEQDWCFFDDHWRTDHATTPVVMEIKCQVCIPAWVTDLIRANDLAQTSFSKYSVGIHITHWMQGRPRQRSRSARVLGAA